MNVIATHALPVTNSAAFDSPFFAMTPGPLLLLMMVILATVATVIASQALISGAFTLTERAIDLSLWPRLTVRHTSTSQKGQVFVPSVNIVLAIGCSQGHDGFSLRRCAQHTVVSEATVGFATAPSAAGLAAQLLHLTHDARPLPDDMVIPA